MEQDDEVEIHGETRKNEKIKKARILLRQLRTVELGTYDVPDDFEKICEPDHEPIAAWSVIEWDGSGFQLSSLDQNLDGGVGMVNMSPYKYGWSRFKTCTTTLWKSHLFFTGGLKPGLGRYYLNAVGSFNIKSQDWIKLPEMKQPRCFNTACTVGDHIYVFGSAYKPLKLLLPMATWGERFDILSSKWFNLPQPPESLYKLHHIRAYAVYHNCQAFSYLTQGEGAGDGCFQVEENHNLILFPLPILSLCDSSRICVFDCDTHTWLPDICPNVPPSEPIYPYGPRTRPLRHDRLAIVDGILFWHRSRKIYGYDLINQEYLSSLFQLPPEKQDELYLHDDNLMFFINPGDHELVIVFQIPRNEYTIHCYLFRVQTENPRIVRKLYSDISTECMKRERLLDALLWCDEVPDLDGQPQKKQKQQRVSEEEKRQEEDIQLPKFDWSKFTGYKSNFDDVCKMINTIKGSLKPKHHSLLNSTAFGRFFNMILDNKINKQMAEKCSRSIMTLIVKYVEEKMSFQLKNKGKLIKLRPGDVSLIFGMLIRGETIFLSENAKRRQTQFETRLFPNKSKKITKSH